MKNKLIVTLIIMAASIVLLGIVEGVALGLLSGVVIFYIGYVAKRGYKRRYEKQKGDIARLKALRKMNITRDSGVDVVTKDGYTSATVWNDVDGKVSVGDAFESDIIYDTTRPRKKKLKHLVPSDKDLIFDWAAYHSGLSPTGGQRHTTPIAIGAK